MNKAQLKQKLKEIRDKRKEKSKFLGQDEEF